MVGVRNLIHPEETVQNNKEIKIHTNHKMIIFNLEKEELELQCVIKMEIS
jgi:hypothetical protein